MARSAGIVLYETGRHLESQRMDLHQAADTIVWSSSKGKELALREELEMRDSSISKKDRTGDCLASEELRRICCAEADGATTIEN